MYQNKEFQIFRLPVRIIDGKYKLIRKIGNGTFGQVYQAVNVDDNCKVAVKLENSSSGFPRLDFEARLYRILAGGNGIAKMYFSGKENEYNALVIDLLGPSLQDHFNKCERHFTLKTVLMLAIQMITLLELIHSKTYIHGDIKPENFLMGRDSNSQKVFLIDFGMAKKFTQPLSERHIPYRENRLMSGTVPYVSINTHLGREQSRRDDMESLGYVLMYFNRGKLPWHEQMESDEKVAEKKLSIPISELCKGFPEQFATYLEYCRNLHFDEEPQYTYLRRLFETVLEEDLKHEMDYVYDWPTPMQESSEFESDQTIDEKKRTADDDDE